MRLSFLTAVAIACAASGHAAPEFVGYGSFADGFQFILSDAESGATSGFLKQGGSFEGYRITRFDRKSEALVVEREGVETRLSLKESKIRNAADALVENVSELRITITADGKFMSEGSVMSVDALRSRLVENERGGALTKVYVQNARDGKASDFDRLLEIIAHSGVKRLHLKIVVPPAVAETR